jgi:type II secretory pathway pseudopilin PulG
MGGGKPLNNVQFARDTANLEQKNFNKIGVKSATSCVHKTFFALACEEKCCSPCGYFSARTGITLIALIITIIIMLILAGVTINIAMNGSLFGQAQNARDTQNAVAYKEEIELAVTDAIIKIYAEGNIPTLDDVIAKLDTNIYTIEDGENGTKLIKRNGGIAILDKDLKVTVEGAPSGSYAEEEEAVIDEEKIPEFWEVVSKNDSSWYSYNDISNSNTQGIVNVPKIVKGMIPIKYTGSNNTIGGLEGTYTSRWANAMTQDGSMWVWIPRFAYKITSEYHQSAAGTIAVKFIDVNNNYLDGTAGTPETDPSNLTYVSNAQQEWFVHPAFSFAGHELTGIWVSKFSPSNDNGKVKIIPNATAWANILVESAYNKSKEMSITNYETYGFTSNTSAVSHMMKDSEFGAMIYLGHSQYGVNGIKVQPRYSNITGTYSSATNTYDTTQGILTSTSGNVYGVYDACGRPSSVTATSVTAAKVPSFAEVDNGFWEVIDNLNWPATAGHGIYETSSGYSTNNGNTVNGWFSSSTVHMSSGETLLRRKSK